MTGQTLVFVTTACAAVIHGWKANKAKITTKDKTGTKHDSFYAPVALLRKALTYLLMQVNVCSYWGNSLM